MDLIIKIKFSDVSLEEDCSHNSLRLLEIGVLDDVRKVLLEGGICFNDSMSMLSDDGFEPPKQIIGVVTPYKTKFDEWVRNNGDKSLFNYKIISSREDMSGCIFDKFERGYYSHLVVNKERDIDFWQCAESRLKKNN
tara:strand:- start:4428 stop:4838 length:411 start_codon:yes stop_codon:yes gene_type:complete